MQVVIENDDQWVELRKNHIGGSEIASLFNCGYLSKYQLFYLKKGLFTPDFNEEFLLWGNELEEAIAKGAAKLHNFTLLDEPKSYYIDDECAGMGCTPDKFILVNNERCILQIKNVDNFSFAKWDNEETPPLKFQIQLQHEIACTNVNKGYLACLIGGNKLKFFPYDKHEVMVKYIRKNITDFWDMFNKEQEPNFSAEDYDVMKHIYKGEIKETIDLSSDQELNEVCEEYEAINKQMKELEEKQKFIKSFVLNKISNNEKAIVKDYKIINATRDRKAYTVNAGSYNVLTIKRLDVSI